MPCYQTQTCNCELNNADADLLEKALQADGYTVRRNSTGMTFSKNGVSGSYNNKQIALSGQDKKKLDTDAIKRAYAEQVIQQKARRMKAKGWFMYKEKDEYVFTTEPKYLEQKKA